MTPVPVRECRPWGFGPGHLDDIQPNPSDGDYPPVGDRGVATYNRAYGFGLHPERLETANQRVLGIVQIESRQAVERVEEIAKVPGIHVLFIGPRDLSHDLGVPSNTSAPAFQDALRQVLAAADAAGLAAGILAPDAQTARHYATQGLRFIGIGSDATLLALAGKHAIDSVHATPHPTSPMLRPRADTDSLAPTPTP